MIKAAFRMSETLTLEEKNAICPASIHYGPPGQVFEYTRRNIGQGNVVYYCTHNRKCKCKGKLSFNRDKRTGVVDQAIKFLHGQHNRACCVINQVDPDEYNWEGKQTYEEALLVEQEEGDENVDPNPSPSKARMIAAVDTRVKLTRRLQSHQFHLHTCNGKRITVNKSKYGLYK